MRDSFRIKLEPSTILSIQIHNLMIHQFSEKPQQKQRRILMHIVRPNDFVAAPQSSRNSISPQLPDWAQKRLAV